LYDRLVQEIHEHASSRTVRQWEVDEERLTVSCISTKEGNEERGRGRIG
jgi:hypothetical protein